jgi:Transglutaminase-like superfamily
LRIGVKRDAAGKFVAHAWLEKDGRTLIGGGAHKSYCPMPPLSGLERHVPPELSEENAIREQIDPTLTQRNTELMGTRRLD